LSCIWTHHDSGGNPDSSLYGNNCATLDVLSSEALGEEGVLKPGHVSAALTMSVVPEAARYSSRSYRSTAYRGTIANDLNALLYLGYLYCIVLYELCVCQVRHADSV
jgi:hypothetical protein